MYTLLSIIWMPYLSPVLLGNDAMFYKLVKKNMGSVIVT